MVYRNNRNDLIYQKLKPANMKNLAILFVVLFAVTACTEVHFEQAQPVGAKALKEIPKELQGKFGLVILGEESILEISSNSIIKDDGKEDVGEAYLSDSLIIKKLGNRYVLNTMNKDPNGLKEDWSVFVFEEKGCGFVKVTSFFVNSDTYTQKLIEQYPDHKLVDGGQSKTLTLSPSADQFKSLLADDSVTVSMILERLN